MKKDQPFHSLESNFGEYAIDLLPHQVLAYASQHPQTIVESDITHEEMLSLIPDDVDIAMINKHMADKREQHMEEDDNPVTTAEIHLNVLHDKENKISNMLRNFQQM